MKVGPRIYEHADGRWEARYRKGRRPDGSIIYGSVYGRTYEEAERKRADFLRSAAEEAENTGAADATEISENNRGILDYYESVPKNRIAFPAPLSEEEVSSLIPVIETCRDGLRLAAYFALFMGVSCEELAALRYCDIDVRSGEVTVCRCLADVKHMPGMMSACRLRKIRIPKAVSDRLDLFRAANSGKNSFIVTGTEEHIKSIRALRTLWSKRFSSGCDRKITPEVFRATFIRRCFEKGINAETVSEITGIGVQTLRTRYGSFMRSNPALLDSVPGTEPEKTAVPRQMNLLILGAGSHGHAVYEIADRLGIFQKISFLDDSITGDGIVGRVEDVLDYRKEYPMCFVAIGNNERRKELAEKVTKAGFITPRLISPETSVARGISIGRGTIIMPQATVNTGAKIGDFCIIASNSLIGFNATVENFSHCDCASVVMKDCTVSTLMTVESGEIVKEKQAIS